MFFVLQKGWVDLNYRVRKRRVDEEVSSCHGCHDNVIVVGRLERTIHVCMHSRMHPWHGPCLDRCTHACTVNCNHQLCAFNQRGEMEKCFCTLSQFTFYIFHIFIVWRLIHRSLFIVHLFIVHCRFSLLRCSFSAFLHF